MMCLIYKKFSHNFYKLFLACLMMEKGSEIASSISIDIENSKFVKSKLLLIFLFIILLTINLIYAENLNLKITGTVNNITSDVYLKTNPSATDVIDSYDMYANDLPSGNYSQFYSSVNSQKLSIDSWASNPRTIYLVYSLSAAQNGTLDFSWNALTGSYDATFTYYGTDNSYATSVGSVNMRTGSSYSASISTGTSFYAKVAVSDYSAPSTTTTTSGGGGGTTTKTVSLKIEVPTVSKAPASGEINLPITLSNDGQTDFKGVTISSKVLKDYELSNIKPEFDRTFIDLIAAGKKEIVNLKLTLDKDELAFYDVIIDVNSTTPVYKTSNHFYVDYLSQNASGVKKIIVFADNLLVENPECLELKEMVDEAKKLFDGGNLKEATMVANKAIEACKKSISGPQNFIFPLSNKGIRITFYLIVTTIASIGLGVLFYFYRIWRFRRRKEKFKR